MTPDLNPSSTAAEDRATRRIVSTAITRVHYLERQLIGEGGHRQGDVSPARAEEIIARINDLRQALAWLQIDLDDERSWPGRADEALTAHQRVA